MTSLAIIIAPDTASRRPGFGLERQFLHASGLEFAHPVTGVARQVIPDGDTRDVGLDLVGKRVFPGRRLALPPRERTLSAVG